MNVSEQSAAFSGQDNYLPPDLQSQLLDGEYALWSGQPLRRIIFHRSDLLAIPFSLFWGGFTVVWELMATGVSNPFAIQLEPNLFMMLWGIPFVLIGQYLIWGRFIHTAWKKRRTYYALTNQRVLVALLGSQRKFLTMQLTSLESCTLTLRNDDAGTIDFSPQPEAQTNWSADRRVSAPQMGTNLSRLTFYDISEAQSVHRMIQKQRQKEGSLDTPYAPQF
ncbi:hypothetical protein [Silvibacterium acidisoli]|uniref:hypothetical protein n=1 Tax=Acidobacteriaceae bacterium ZG23-2 TaxID=2883246 RepID=UPI00406BF104